MEKKKVLIPNGGVTEWGLINAAHRLGLYVITSGLVTNAPGHQFADEYCPADYSDKEAMLKLAKEKKIDYIVTNAHDAGMLSTAYVCEKLGLPGHDSYETTLTIHSKDRFKQVARKLGLHSPVAEIFTNREKAIDYVRNCGFDVIIKPSDNASSVGVSRPHFPEEIESCVNFAFAKSKDATIIIEPFVEGFFATVTSMIINQEVVAFFANSSYPYPQGVVLGNEFPANKLNNGGSRPALYIDDFAPSIIADFNKLAKELKLVDGKFHCELLINPKDHTAQIFDVHRRMSGEAQPWHEWDETTGLNWQDWIVRAECGMDLSGFPKGIKQNRFFHNRSLYAPKNGIMKRIILDEYLTSHLYPKYEGKNYILYNKFTGDCLHNPIVDLDFEFDSQQEMESLAAVDCDNFYPHVTFEYEEF